jgi:glycosyltransferase involved in cell wall biosynthesis
LKNNLNEQTVSEQKSFAENTENNFSLAAPELSLLLPVLNEAANLRPLHEKIQKALDKLDKTVEIIYVDDGSTDGSLEILRHLARFDSRVRVISFRRNYGQAAALSAGIDAARGKILISIDADLQNDPADISKLLEKLDEGYDVVSGWRVNRQDALITRKIPSQIVNSLISAISGVPLHDYFCSLKAYRRDVLQDARLCGETPLFIPIFAVWTGGRIAEIPVEHHARAAGKSKYGLSRAFKILLDFITIKFIISRQFKPIYVFAVFGLIAFAFSFIAGLSALYLKLVESVSFFLTPLPLIAIVMLAIAAQFFLTGLLAEIFVRAHQESQAKPIYFVREQIGFEHSDRNQQFSPKARATD